MNLLPNPTAASALKSGQSIEIRLNDGQMGRIWEIRTGLYGWAHPDGSQGEAASFRDAEDALNATQTEEAR